MSGGDDPSPAAGGPGGTEGPAGTEVAEVRSHGERSHSGRPLTDDSWVPRRLFLAMGAGVALLAVIYGATSNEEAGTAMLTVAAILALWSGTYLWLQQRPRAEDDGPGAEADGVAGYLPHASAWPFAIGLGAATLANGLVLGVWVTIPGLALLALGVAGFVRQTRHRD